MNAFREWISFFALVFFITSAACYILERFPGWLRWQWGYYKWLRLEHLRIHKRGQIERGIR